MSVQRDPDYDFVPPALSSSTTPWRGLMPTASDEQRGLMEKWFGDPIDDGRPYRFLQARGYREWAGMLIKPTGAHTVSEYEWACIEFLCDEWDYGFDPTVVSRPDRGGAA